MRRDNENGLCGNHTGVHIIELLVMTTCSGLKTRAAGMEMLAEWARTCGASRIIAAVTRHADHFVKFFYEPAGFKAVGLVIEREV